MLIEPRILGESGQLDQEGPPFSCFSSFSASDLLPIFLDSKDLIFDLEVQLLPIKGRAQCFILLSGKQQIRMLHCQMYLLVKHICQSSSLLFFYWMFL